MKQLKLLTEIHVYENFKEFVDEFKVGKEDLILTGSYIYNEFIQKLNLDCNLVLQNKYGNGEPSDEMINQIIDDIKDMNFKRVIAIGGGTVIDIAKLLIFKDTKDCVDLFERNVDLIKEKELIVIPTTCGTGSEVTNISIAEIKSKNTKLGLASDELTPDYAVLIPELMKNLPFKVFMSSSVDALIHAIESFVSPKSNEFTELFAIKAIEIIVNGYKEIIKNGSEYRTNLLKEFALASNYAGIAFGNTGVGAVHAMSYPLGGVYHVPHGEANYHMFTEVFKVYNKKNPDGKIKEVNKVLAQILNLDKEQDVYYEIENLLNELLTKKPLREFGMKEEETDIFPKNVMKTQQRLLGNNYVQLTEEEMATIYKTLY